jgi:hypothetical protein
MTSSTTLISAPSDDMDPKTIADEIAAYVARTDWVTCGEVLNRFGDGMRGNLALEVLPHVLAWAGISPVLVEAMKILRAERPRRVVLWPIHPLADLCDASPLLRLPTARRLPKNGYKTDRYTHLGLRPIARLRPDERRRAGFDTEDTVRPAAQGPQ